MMHLRENLNLNKFGIASFLIFFLFTPLLFKFKVATGIYVEPLLTIFLLGIASFLLYFFSVSRGWEMFFNKIRNLFLPDQLSVSFYLFMFFLFLAFGYGYILTGFFSLGDLLRLIKYCLYFLPFPIALYVGKYLGRKEINIILLIFITVGITTAVVSFLRIYLYLNFGGNPDFWTYNVYNRSVGFLGQFFDPLKQVIGSTGRSAGGTYGIYASSVLAAVLAFFSKLSDFTKRSFIFIVTANIVIFGAVLYTLSRGAVLVASLVMLGWLFWSWRNGRIKQAILSIFLVFVSSVILVNANQQVYRKFITTISFRSSDEAPVVDSSNEPDVEVVIDSSTRGRIERWQNIFEMFGKEPSFIIFGVGYNTKNLQYFADVGSTHSLFLDMWARGGLTALILLIAVWVFLFRTIYRLAISKNKEIQVYGFTLLGFALGWFIDNLISGEQFLSDAPMIAFWGVLGLVESLRQLNKVEKSKKKILIALTSSEVGGAPQVVYDLLSNVGKSKWGRLNSFEFVLAGPAGGFFNEKFRDLGYRVYPVDLDKISYNTFKKLMQIVQKEEIDLLNSHGKGAGFYSRKIGFILGIPVVQTFHGLHYSRKNPLLRFLYLWFERFLTLFTKLIVNVSKSQEREGLALKLFPKSKSRVVFNGIDPVGVTESSNLRKELGIGEKDFAVAMTARFDEVKGYGRFIGLIPNLVKEIPNLKVIFVGGGEGQERAISKAKDLEVHNSVKFLGERHDVPKILKAVDAFVLPSYHEGLPVSVLEASASGLPVIGSNVVGIKDSVKDGKTGFLVDFEKVKEVTNAFNKLAKSPTLRRKMGERGRDFVLEKFSMVKFVEGTLKVYAEALNG